MAKFIEVTDIGGKKRLINTRWVEEIWELEEGKSGTDIYFAFSTPNAVDQDCIRVQESFEDVKRKVWGCNGE